MEPGATTGGWDHRLNGFGDSPIDFMLECIPIEMKLEVTGYCHIRSVRVLRIEESTSE